MRSQRVIVLILFMLLSALSQAQTSAVYIISPGNGAKVDGRLVKIQFGLTPGVSANGIPEFKLQLDRESPALTNETEYILTWVSPGWHTVTVWLVDANGTPVFGAQSQVRFLVRANG